MRRETRTPMSKSSEIFSDEWVKMNPWMADEKMESKKAISTLRMFHNFPEGIPHVALQERLAKLESIIAENQQRLEIFNSMMKEKGIRAGHGSVGKPIKKGWGRK